MKIISIPLTETENTFNTKKLKESVLANVNCFAETLHELAGQLDQRSRYLPESFCIKDVIHNNKEGMFNVQFVVELFDGCSDLHQFSEIKETWNFTIKGFILQITLPTIHSINDRYDEI